MDRADTSDAATTDDGPQGPHPGVRSGEGPEPTYESPQAERTLPREPRAMPAREPINWRQAGRERELLKAVVVKGKHAFLSNRGGGNLSRVRWIPSTHSCRASTDSSASCVLSQAWMDPRDGIISTLRRNQAFLGVRWPQGHESIMRKANALIDQLMSEEQEPADEASRELRQLAIDAAEARTDAAHETDNHRSGDRGEAEQESAAGAEIRNRFARAHAAGTGDRQAARAAQRQQEQAASVSEDEYIQAVGIEWQDGLAEQPPRLAPGWRRIVAAGQFRFVQCRRSNLASGQSASSLRQTLGQYMEHAQARDEREAEREERQAQCERERERDRAARESAERERDRALERERMQAERERAEEDRRLRREEQQAAHVLERERIAAQRAQADAMTNALAQMAQMAKAFVDAQSAKGQPPQ